ncbi:MAG: sigma-70 family RNA polymerase sigma factor [Bacilli bacterium]|nr:sigma-70 family RNA polymerase sigma factor [Bacilli bacterium]
MEKNKELKDFIKENRLDIDYLINEYYSYIYIIVKNSVSIIITDEDIEEIISDVFLALWKNHSNLKKSTPIKQYLTGIAKNIIKNKYRSTKLNYSISDYEEQLISKESLESLAEEKEQNKIIIDTLKNMKEDEYKIFMMFYYKSKKIKDIAKDLKISESNVKVKLHRIRKAVKENLKNGGYSYGK